MTDDEIELDAFLKVRNGARIVLFTSDEALGIPILSKLSLRAIPFIHLSNIDDVSNLISLLPDRRCLIITSILDLDELEKTLDSIDPLIYSIYVIIFSRFSDDSTTLTDIFNERKLN